MRFTIARDNVFQAIKVVFAISLIVSLVLIFGDNLHLYRRTQPAAGRLELFTFSILSLSAITLMLRTTRRRALGGSGVHNGVFWFVGLLGTVSLFVIAGFLLVAA